jgi:hypothetical protein
VAEFDTLALADAVEAILKADPRCRDMHVTQEFLEAPVFPSVFIDVPSEDRVPRYLTGGIQGGGAPDEITPHLTITITAADVQGARAARRQAHDAARTIVDVLRNDYTLGGTVLTHQCTRIDFARGEPEAQTMYARAMLSIVATAIS